MYFIAGVGVASLFDGDQLVATANTLIDSGITIGTTLEEIRGGQGNKLLGRYGHDSQFSLKLTDALFNLEYIAMNTGSDVELGGDCIISEQLTAASGVLTLSKSPVPFFSDDLASTKVYVKPAVGGGSYKAYPVSGKTVTLETGSTGDYCVRYMYNNNYATRIVINSDFIPKTLSVILEANLYNGGSCDDTDNATLAGKIIIKVPRYMLNGSQEIAMTATGAAQTSLEGMALSYGCKGCDSNGYYAEIVQILANASDDMFSEIIVENSGDVLEVKVNDTITPVIYACPKEGIPMKVKQELVTMTESDKATYADGVVTVTGTGSFDLEFNAYGHKAKLSVTATAAE